MRPRVPAEQSSTRKWSAATMMRRIRYWLHRAGLGGDQIYQSIVDLMGWWPLAWFHRDQPLRSGRTLSVAYVFGRHPILSETFIRREITALSRAGIPLQSVAEEPDPESIAADASMAHSDTIYLSPMDSTRRARFIRKQVRRAPLRTLNVLLYVVFSRYGSYKTWEEDLKVMARAIYLAGVLDEKGVSHVHSPWANYYAFMAMLAARLMGVTYSVHIRANEVHRASSNYMLPAKLRNAHFIVTNSRYNAVHLRSILGVRRAERLHIIYNGLELTRFPLPNARADGPVRILAIGRLVEMKGFDYLLRACALLRERGVEFQCDVIGAAHESLDANTPLELKKLYQRLDLGSIVQFHGAQPFDAVMGFYLQADIVALPCVIASDGSRDITPNVLLEAMAMQRAVVSTPVGAIPEIIDDGINGMIVPSRNERDLADALEKLARDDALRHKLGRAARMKIEERFDIARNIQEYASLFRELSFSVARAEDHPDATPP